MVTTAAAASSNDKGPTEGSVPPPTPSLAAGIKAGKAGDDDGEGKGDKPDPRNLLQPSSLSMARRLMSLARPEAAKLAVALTLLGFSSAVTMSVPFGMGQVLDLVIDGTPTDNRIGDVRFVCLAALGLLK